MIKIHHLNCTMPEFRGFDLKKIGRSMCCHCLLLETESGLVLVDTGVSEAFIHNTFRKFLFAKTSTPLRTAFKEVQQLGFDPKDVRHIFVTHLDHDHVGGLSEFPWAQVYIHATEYEFQSRVNESPMFKVRFQPQLWRHSSIHCLKEPGQPWFQFESVRAPLGMTDEILMIPLFGHTAGHCGFAIKQNDRWLLHAGDAFYFHDDLSHSMAERSLLSESLAMSLAVDQKQRIHNLERLRTLNSQQSQCRIVNSHDPFYLGD